MYVIGDVCMCEYTDHGHCGILDRDGCVINDETLLYLGKIAVSYAKSGVDMVAPSAMMDGEILAIRKALDETGFKIYQSWVTVLNMLPLIMDHSERLLIVLLHLETVQVTKWI